MADLFPDIVIDLTVSETGDVVSASSLVTPVEVNAVETPILFYSPETVGPSGPQGTPGPSGATGAPGAPGNAATVDAGTTTTGAPGTNASVVNTGNTSAAVFAFTIPRGNTGTQGAQGPSGASGTPGPTGSPAWTLTTNASFTVPAYGASITVNVADTSWMTLGEWVYIDDAAGAGTAGQMVITAKTANSVTLFNPAPTVYLPPLASPTANGALRQVSGNTSDFIDGTNNSQALAPAIWSVRLRNFNAIGNPSFEVDQVNVNAFVSNLAAGAKTCDRWQFQKSGTATATVNTQVANSAVSIVPGTNFCISNSQQLLQLGTQQTTLAVGEYVFLQQSMEGPRWRELSADVTSISLLVYSTVALKFALSLRSASSAQSLCKLCTIPTANTWTLITLPNLPKPPSGTFSTLPGNVGVVLSICLAVGTTYMPPANDVWQNGNFLGAVGMDNWCSKTVGSNFYLGFVQHEPGPVCTTLIDKPFAQNLIESQRYYTKSYNYGVKPGAANSQGGEIMIPALANAQGFAGIPFKVTMGKIPTIIAYDPVGGAPNGVYDLGSSSARTVSAIVNPGDSGFGGVQFTTPSGANTTYLLQYIADTGW